MNDKFNLKFETDNLFQSSAIEKGDVIKLENKYQSQPDLFLKTQRLVSKSSRLMLKKRFKKPTIQKHIDKVILMDYSAKNKIR